MSPVAGHLWSRFPSDLPSRLRFALLAFATILVATCVPFAVFNSSPIWSRCLLTAFYAVVLIRWTAWFRGGRPVPADLIVELLALMATTVVTADPSNSASFLYAGVIFRAFRIASSDTLRPGPGGATMSKTFDQSCAQMLPSRCAGSGPFCGTTSPYFWCSFIRT